MNYDGKKFRSFSSSENAEVSDEVIFEYHQNGNVLTCQYQGGAIKKGQLLGIVSKNGAIDMRYHQILKNGSLQTGVCQSTPEFRDDGRIRLHEKWKWTSGDFSEGNSILEEL